MQNNEYSCSLSRATITPMNKCTELPPATAAGDLRQPNTLATAAINPSSSTVAANYYIE